MQKWSLLEPEIHRKIPVKQSTESSRSKIELTTNYTNHKNCKIKNWGNSEIAKKWKNQRETLGYLRMQSKNTDSQRMIEQGGSDIEAHLQVLHWN